MLGLIVFMLAQPLTGFALPRPPTNKMNLISDADLCRKILSSPRELQQLNEEKRHIMRSKVLRFILLEQLPQDFNYIDSNASRLIYGFLDDAAWLWKWPIQDERFEGIQKLMLEILKPQTTKWGSLPDSARYFTASGPTFDDPPEQVALEAYHWQHMVESLRGLQELVYR